MKKIFMLMGLLSNLCFGAMAHSQTWESGYTLFAAFPISFPNSRLTWYQIGRDPAFAYIPDFQAACS